MNPDPLNQRILPDNLKLLFRPVAMMMPDMALISEVMLYSNGFQKAKILVKFVPKAVVLLQLRQYLPTCLGILL